MIVYKYNTQDQEKKTTKYKNKILLGIFDLFYQTQTQSLIGNVLYQLILFIECLQLQYLFIFDKFDNNWTLEFSQGIQDLLQVWQVQTYTHGNEISSSAREAFLYITLSIIFLATAFIILFFSMKTIKTNQTILKILDFYFNLSTTILILPFFFVLISNIICMQPDQEKITQTDPNILKFPEDYCYSMGHLVHMILAIIGIILYTLQLLTIYQYQIFSNPFQSNPQSAHSNKLQILKIIIKLFAVFYINQDVTYEYQKIFIISLTVLVLFLLFNRFKNPEFYQTNIQKFTTCCEAVTLYFGLIMIVRMYYIQDENQEYIENYDSKIIKYYLIGIPLICFQCFKYNNYYENKILNQNISNFNKPYDLKLYIISLIRLIRRERKTKLGQVKIFGMYKYHQDCCNNKQCPCRSFNQIDSDYEFLQNWFNILETMLENFLVIHPKSTDLLLLNSILLHEKQGKNYSAVTELMKIEEYTSDIRQLYLVYYQKNKIEEQIKIIDIKKSLEQQDFVNKMVNYQNQLDIFKSKVSYSVDIFQQFWEELLETNSNLNRLHYLGIRIIPTTHIVRKEFYKLIAISGENLRILEIYSFYLKYITNDKLESQKLLSRMAFMQKDQQMNQIQSEITGKQYQQHSKGLVMTISANLRTFGDITSVNQQLMRILGYTKEELQGQNINTIMPRHISQEHDDILKRCIYTSITQQFEEKHVYPINIDGYCVPCVLKVKQLPNLFQGLQFVGYLQEMDQSHCPPYNLINYGERYTNHYIIYNPQDFQISSCTQSCYEFFGLSFSLTNQNSSNATQFTLDQLIPQINNKEIIQKLLDKKEIQLELDSTFIPNQYLMSNLSIDMGKDGEDENKNNSNQEINFNFYQQKQSQIQTHTHATADNSSSIGQISSPIKQKLTEKIQKQRAQNQQYNEILSKQKSNFQRMSSQNNNLNIENLKSASSIARKSGKVTKEDIEILQKLEELQEITDIEEQKKQKKQNESGHSDDTDDSEYINQQEDEDDEDLRQTSKINARTLDKAFTLTTMGSTIQKNIEHDQYLEEKYKQTEIKVQLVEQLLGLYVIKFYDVNEPHKKDPKDQQKNKKFTGGGVLENQKQQEFQKLMKERKKQQEQGVTDSQLGSNDNATRADRSKAKKQDFTKKQSLYHLTTSGGSRLSKQFNGNSELQNMDSFIEEQPDTGLLTDKNKKNKKKSKDYEIQVKEPSSSSKKYQKDREASQKQKQKLESARQIKMIKSNLQEKKENKQILCLSYFSITLFLIIVSIVTFQYTQKKQKIIDLSNSAKSLYTLYHRALLMPRLSYYLRQIYNDVNGINTSRVVYNEDGSVNMDETMAIYNAQLKTNQETMQGISEQIHEYQFIVMEEIDFLNSIQDQQVGTFKEPVPFLQSDGTYIYDELEIRDDYLLQISAMQALEQSTFEQLIDDPNVPYRNQIQRYFDYQMNHGIYTLRLKNAKLTEQFGKIQIDYIKSYELPGLIATIICVVALASFYGMLPQILKISQRQTDLVIIFSFIPVQQLSEFVQNCQKYKKWFIIERRLKELERDKIQEQIDHKKERKRLKLQMIIHLKQKMAKKHKQQTQEQSQNQAQQVLENIHKQQQNNNTKQSVETSQMNLQVNQSVDQNQHSLYINQNDISKAELVQSQNQIGTQNQLVPQSHQELDPQQIKEQSRTRLDILGDQIEQNDEQTFEHQEKLLAQHKSILPKKILQFSILFIILFAYFMYDLDMQSSFTNDLIKSLQHCALISERMQNMVYLIIYIREEIITNNIRFEEGQDIIYKFQERIYTIEQGLADSMNEGFPEAYDEYVELFKYVDTANLCEYMIEFNFGGPGQFPLETCEGLKNGMATKGFTPSIYALVESFRSFIAEIRAVKQQNPENKLTTEQIYQFNNDPEFLQLIYVFIQQREVCDDLTESYRNGYTKYIEDKDDKYQNWYIALMAFLLIMFFFVWIPYLYYLRIKMINTEKIIHIIPISIIYKSKEMRQSLQNVGILDKNF